MYRTLRRIYAREYLLLEWMKYTNLKIILKVIILKKSISWLHKVQRGKGSIMNTRITRMALPSDSQKCCHAIVLLWQKQFHIMLCEWPPDVGQQQLPREKNWDVIIININSYCMLAQAHINSTDIPWTRIY